MKILQINTTLNTGSTGRIAEEIGDKVILNGGVSYIAYSRYGNSSDSHTVKIGSKVDLYLHILKSRVYDRHGFGSLKSTQFFCTEIEKINPDIIHLHNIHGYYLNIEILFNFLKEFNKPVVWTFHDCWSFTGHCAHFENTNCYKWKEGCFSCPKTRTYPKSFFVDNSKMNYLQKKELFTSLENLWIITPSDWLTNQVKNSFFRRVKTATINNGIDLDVFQPITSTLIYDKYKLNPDTKIILGVASIWAKHRGLDDFIELSKILNDNFLIVLVGLKKRQIKKLPKNIFGIERTENRDELVALYNCSFVYINPTYVDTFPTTNIEALACGTPVITYNTGGSPESIDDYTGIVIQKGDIQGILKAIETILTKKDKFTPEYCRSRAVRLFNKNERFEDYYSLYMQLMSDFTSLSS